MNRPALLPPPADHADNHRRTTTSSFRLTTSRPHFYPLKASPHRSPTRPSAASPRLWQPGSTRRRSAKVNNDGSLAAAHDRRGRFATVPRPTTRAPPTARRCAPDAFGAPSMPCHRCRRAAATWPPFLPPGGIRGWPASRSNFGWQRCASCTAPPTSPPPPTPPKSPRPWPSSAATPPTLRRSERRR